MSGRSSTGPSRPISPWAASPRTSSEALSEQAWTYIKAKEWKKAYRALDLLLLTIRTTGTVPNCGC